MKPVIVAFPGSGKSTTARNMPGVIDLDFGMFRAAHQIAKSGEIVLLEPFARLCQMYANDGFYVLTNEPKLMPYLKQKQVPMEMVVPSRNLMPELVRRVESREAEHPVNRAFVQDLKQHHHEWASDWRLAALKYGVPLYTGWVTPDYIREIVDKEGSRHDISEV